MKNFVPCAFVNDQNPVGYGAILGYKVSSNEDWPKSEELILSVIRNVHYQHPDAPDDAVLIVPENRIMIRVQPGDSKYPLIKMLQLNQLACQQLVQSNW